MSGVRPISRIVYLIGILLYLSSAIASDETFFSAPPAGFCMQNFNMYGPAYATEVKQRTELVAGELLSRASCDVVHFQEVWNASHITQVENLLDEEYKISSPNRDARIGLMSLFQHNLQAKETYFFKLNSASGVLEDIRDILNIKKAFHVVVADPRYLGEEIYFVNTHLHPTSQVLRATQIMDLLEWRLSHLDRKMVLTGDFNSDPGSLENHLVKALFLAQDAYQEAWQGYPEGTCTYCSVNPRSWLGSDHVFDYIYFSNVGQVSSTLVAVEGHINLKGTPRKSLSDHYGVKINFELKSGYQLPDAIIQEERRQAVLSVLAQASQILLDSGYKEVLPYLQQIKTLQAQIENSQGSFSDYLKL